MSLNPEEKNTNPSEEESTIFTASPTKVAKKEAPQKSFNKKMVISLVAVIMAIALIGTGTWAAFHFAPKQEKEEQTENESVVSIAPEKIKEVTITRKDSASTYLSTVKDVKNPETGKMEKEVTWTIKGIDPTVTESVVISAMLDSAFSLYSARVIEPEEGADYGFSDPQYVIKMTGYDAADSRTLTVGKESPSSSGVYATLGKEIFLISIETAADFGKSDEQMATSFAIEGATVDGATLNYFYEDKLTRFDKITLSGKNFKKTLTFAMSDVSNTGNYNDYIMTSPVRRFADTAAVGSLLEYAKTGLTAAEAYKYNPTAADLKKYGLDKPEMQLLVEFGGRQVGFKATRYDDDYYAVVVLGRENVIFKVAESFLTIAEYKETDFANNLMFIEILTDFENITFETAGKKYSFDIRYKPATEETEQVLDIMMDGKRIDARNFQNFYQHLVVECNEKTLDKTSGSPVLTMTATRGGDKTTMKFIKATDRRYYVEVDSAPIGFISSTKMDNITNYLADVIAGKEVPGIG